jgi:YD repeat-containing protein
MPHRAAVRSVLIFSLCLGSHVDLAAAQQSAIQYAYDELGRLVAVVDQQGNAAIYVYDAVGNMLAIQRVDAATLPGPVAITAVVPEKGKAGTVVSILGKGFRASPGQNLVAFNGVGASVAQGSGNRIITTVPPGATTGPITVMTPLGSAISPRSFRIVGAIVVTPATATLGTGGTQQFVASDGGVETTNVLWAIDGLVGGDPDVGTISPQGFYRAPPTIPALRTATVTATSRDDASVVATAVVTLRSPTPLFLAAASLGVQVADPGPRTLVAPGVGVQRAPEAAGLTIVAAAIAVTPPARDAFAGVAQVSVSRAPLITSVSPAAAVRGSTTLTLTLTGSDLAAVSSLEFLLNNAIDTAITVSNLDATVDGTQATAQISIAAGAALGPRVVRIRAPAGTTMSVGAGGNVFTVQ